MRFLTSRLYLYLIACTSFLSLVPTDALTKNDEIAPTLTIQIIPERSERRALFSNSVDFSISGCRWSLEEPNMSLGAPLVLDYTSQEMTGTNGEVYVCFNPNVSDSRAATSLVFVNEERRYNWPVEIKVEFLWLSDKDADTYLTFSVPLYVGFDTIVEFPERLAKPFRISGVRYSDELEEMEGNKRLDLNLLAQRNSVSKSDAKKNSRKSEFIGDYRILIGAIRDSYDLAEAQQTNSRLIDENINLRQELREARKLSHTATNNADLKQTPNVQFISVVNNPQCGSIGIGSIGRTAELFDVYLSNFSEVSAKVTISIEKRELIASRGSSQNRIISSDQKTVLLSAGERQKFVGCRGIEFDKSPSVETTIHVVDVQEN